MHFLFSLLPDFLQTYGTLFLSGLWVTLTLVFLSIGFGFLLGIPLAILRFSRFKSLRALAWAYMSFFRGTPLMAQTFLVYYGSGDLRPLFETLHLWCFFQNSFFCVAFIFSLNSAAYQAEIMRQAFLEVPQGQHEAAQSLGFRNPLGFLLVILPQAAFCALRPFGNEVALMIKASAIASVVTVLDIMAVAKISFSRTFDFQAYLWAALLYLILMELTRRGFDALEIKIGKYKPKKN